MYVHTYGIWRIFQKPLSVYGFTGVYRRGFSLRFSLILSKSKLFWRYITVFYIRILAYFCTYVCILWKIQAIYGCIRILRRFIRNTLTYITYATSTAYNWSNIRVWTQPYPPGTESDYFSWRMSQPQCHCWQLR